MPLFLPWKRSNLRRNIRWKRLYLELPNVFEFTHIEWLIITEWTQLKSTKIQIKDPRKQRKGNQMQSHRYKKRSKDIQSRTQPNNKMHKWWRTQLNQIQYIKDSAQTKTMYISRTQYSLIKQCISWTQLSQQKCIIYQGPSPNLQCKKR